MVDVLAKLQAAAPLTRAEALEAEAEKRIAARLEREARRREAHTSGTARKKYTPPTASGLRYTIAGHRVNSVEDVKAIIPKIVEEYGVSRSEAKRIAHKMLHADKGDVAESKLAVKEAAKVKRREGMDAGNRIPMMPAGTRDRMKWETRDSRHVRSDLLTLRNGAGISHLSVKALSKIVRLDVRPARPEAVWSGK